MSVRIAYRYAKSLYSQAEVGAKTAEVAEDMRQLIDLCASNKEFTAFLDSPVIAKKSKKSAIEKIFQSSNGVSKSLYLLMTEKNRENLLPEMAKEYLHLFNQANKITEAEVTAPVALDAETIQAVSEFVKANTGAKQVNITTKEDKNLIGGMKIMFEGKLYDSSISTQINNLKKELNIA